VWNQRNRRERPCEGEGAADQCTASSGDGSTQRFPFCRARAEFVDKAVANADIVVDSTVWETGLSFLAASAGIVPINNTGDIRAPTLSGVRISVHVN
jgi:hypothetical protein